MFLEIDLNTKKKKKATWESAPHLSVVPHHAVSLLPLEDGERYIADTTTLQLNAQTTENQEGKGMVFAASGDL